MIIDQRWSFTVKQTTACDSNKHIQSPANLFKAIILGRRAFAVAGPSEWNNLSVSIRHAPSIGSFKTKLKTLFFKFTTDNNIVVTVH